MCLVLKTLLYLSFGIIFGSYQVFSCTSTTVQYKQPGYDVTIQFQATTVNSQNSALSVTNQILSKNDSPLLTALYRNGANIYISSCNNCTFTGNAASGDLSIRLDNIQVSDGGTYKLSVTDLSREVKECVLVYILGIPTKSSIVLDKVPFEGESAVLTCSSISTTTPKDQTLRLMYTWKVNNKNLNDQRYTFSNTRNILTIFNINRNDASKQFTCTATENITNAYTSISSDSFSIDVNYAPFVKPFNVGPVVEGSILSVVCNNDPGKPANTTYSWTRKINSSFIDSWDEIPESTTNGNQLVKLNISRTDVGLYKCTASNRNGGKAELGSSSQTFLLDVLYPAAVTTFVVEGHTLASNVTLDENDEGIQLLCDVDSNPASSLKIMFQNEVRKETSDANHVSYTFSSVSCLDTGPYSCEGNNGIGPSTRRSVHLFVNCSPRPLDRISANISNLPQTSVLLSFTALAYPYPGAKGFSWEKEDGSNWTRILANRVLRIFSTPLQTNLTIFNTTKADYGRYRLTVRNDFGTYVQHYNLTEKIFDEGLSESGAICDTVGNDKSTFITGVCLGIVNAILVGYGILVTILYRRNATRKETQGNKTLKEKEYVNIAQEKTAIEDISNVVENQQEHRARDDPCKPPAQVEEIKHYMDLSEYSRDDKSTYDELRSQSF